MTYDQLAAARDINRDVARRLARRHRWPRQIGNDGLARVLVPPEWQERRREAREKFRLCHCGVEFWVNHPAQKTCSNECRLPRKRKLSLVVDNPPEFHTEKEPISAAA